MNLKVVLKVVGIVLFWEAVLMIPSLIISAIDSSYEAKAFVITIIITALTGFLLSRLKLKGVEMRKRDGFAAVALSWLALSAFGALPFFLSGSIPAYVDALFETVSGFTTTGSSIVRNIEIMPRGLLFWRSFTHWIGGMGVLIFTLALLPSIGGRPVFLMRAESPGPAPGKLVPKIGESSKILYIIYTVMTAIVIVLLILAGMPVFNSFIYAFGAAGTGGFAMDALSIGAYNNPWIEWIITISMFLFGVNFSLYFFWIKGDWKNIFKNEELRLYITYALLGVLLIVINVLPKYNYNYLEAIRHSAFTVSSLVTTTGYATEDFNLWPMFSKSILLTLMVFGACAGSTGGGVKSIRILVLIKSVYYEIKRNIHPKSIQRIKIDSKSIDDDTLKSIMIFFTAYVSIVIVSVIIVSLDNFDFMTSFSAVIATISNIGPGFEVVGPMGNYADFSILSKLVLLSDMILGRLEIIPVIMLFSPEIWRKH